MWMSVKEAAKELGVGKRSIQAACKRESRRYKYRIVDGIGGLGGKV